jgi:hypothetical protein
VKEERKKRKITQRLHKENNDYDLQSHYRHGIKKEQKKRKKNYQLSYQKLHGTGC